MTSGVSFNWQLPGSVNAAHARDGTVFAPVGSAATFLADASYAAELINMGCTGPATVSGRKVTFSIPPTADLISVKAAAAPANGPITIAAQPAQPCKLRVNIVVTSGSITNGILTLVGTDQNGKSQSRAYSIVTGVSAAFNTNECWMTLLPTTNISTLAFTGTITISIGQTSALGLPYDAAAALASLVVTKENVDGLDDGPLFVVDTIAWSVIPHTAPNGVHNYEVYYNFLTAVTR
jgi:hypothetical protein